MRVMHIALGGCLKAPPIDYGLTEDTGGHIAYVLGAALAQAQRSEIDHVDIVTRLIEAPDLGAAYARAEETVAPGCTIRRLRTARTAYLSKEALEAELPALRQALLAMLADPARRPDVIHAHFADAAELAAAAEARFGIPWIYSSHSLGLEKSAGRTPAPALARRIAREGRAIAAAPAIVASSRDEAERQLPAYCAEAEGRVHRINPGIVLRPGGDAARARRLIAPFLSEPDKPVILAIARPIRKKNLAALVEAYGRSEALQARANLVILAGLRRGIEGNGAEQDAVIRDLFDRVDRHDLWGRVALPRRHDGGDVAALYRLAAEDGVFCNPAHHEPFGLTLIEAAQSGVPVVATRNGGPIDIVRTIGAGKLIDPEDPDAIASALLVTLEDDLRAPRARAAQKVAQTAFDWHRWAADVARVIAGLGAGRDTAAAPANSAAPDAAMVVCDIDGTLTGDAAAAARFAEWARNRPAGLRFAVATGRSLTEARRVLAAWQLPDPDLFITSCGSEIWRWGPRGRLDLCADYAARLDWPRDALARRLARTGLAPQAEYEQRRWKLSYFGSAAEAAELAAELVPDFPGLRVVASHGKFIDLLPAAAGKANAIRFEAARRGLAERDCVVAGDSGNDADMLTGFARAILPANALDDLDGLAGLDHAHRSDWAFADGVLDGLARFGLAARPRPAGSVTHA
ncbi:HAD family hydrolase [Roseivivax sp. CAU 1761]